MLKTHNLTEKQKTAIFNTLAYLDTLDEESLKLEVYDVESDCRISIKSMLEYLKDGFEE